MSKQDQKVELGGGALLSFQFLSTSPPFPLSSFLAFLFATAAPLNYLGHSH